jgi:hypothetical protein
LPLYGFPKGSTYHIISGVCLRRSSLSVVNLLLRKRDLVMCSMSNVRSACTSQDAASARRAGSVKRRAGIPVDIYNITDISMSCFVRNVCKATLNFPHVPIKC